jgi:7-carboxy-7-deazaguanine synthase
MVFNEIFRGFQGEGETVGQPRLFIRFNECNLSCYYCDSKMTWGKGDKQLLIEDYKELLMKYKKWCITGGEPLLKQTEIKEIMEIYDPVWIEIETNGTIIPNTYLIQSINLWNISPKRQKDMSKNEKTTPHLLENKNLLKDYIVKFVVENEEDWKFVEDIKNEFNIDNNKVWIMPKSIFNKEKDDLLRIEIYNKALELGYNFTPRLHVMLFGNKRGV